MNLKNTKSFFLFLSKEKNMKDEIILLIVAIICLTTLSITNYIITGTDGVILTTVASTISALCTLAIKQEQERRKQRRAEKEKKEKGMEKA